jgi:hypothetical protein
MSVKRLPKLLRPFRVLGIESSADDSAAAIVTSDRRILSSIVEKQHHIHGKSTLSVLQVSTADLESDACPEQQALEGYILSRHKMDIRSALYVQIDSRTIIDALSFKPANRYRKSLERS